MELAVGQFLIQAFLVPSKKNGFPFVDAQNSIPFRREVNGMNGQARKVDEKAKKGENSVHSVLCQHMKHTEIL